MHVHLRRNRWTKLTIQTSSTSNASEMATPGSITILAEIGLERQGTDKKVLIEDPQTYYYNYTYNITIYLTCLLQTFSIVIVTYQRTAYALSSNSLAAVDQLNRTILENPNTLSMFPVRNSFVLGSKYNKELQYKAQQLDSLSSEISVISVICATKHVSNQYFEHTPLMETLRLSYKIVFIY